MCSCSTKRFYFPGADRYDGMPIRMIAKDGRILSGYYCAKNSPAEVKTIIEMGMKNPKRFKY